MSTAECCTPAPPATSEFLGKESTLAGCPVYITGSSSSSSAVLFLSDIFGYRKPLLRKLADKVSHAGFLVVVPDLLHDDPFTGSFSTGELRPWQAKHPPTGYALDMTKSLVEALKDQGMGSVGAAGFCWGAKTAVTLGKENVVKAVVQCHPSGVAQADYEEVVVPISVLAAPSDGVDKYVDLLEKRTEVKSFVKIFPGVTHGWTLRYDENDEVAMEQATAAHNLLIEWFTKYM